jgi:hypothetical protein
MNRFYLELSGRSSNPFVLAPLRWGEVVPSWFLFEIENLKQIPFMIITPPSRLTNDRGKGKPLINSSLF